MMFSKELLSAIENVWAQIESDAYELCDNDNTIALEFVLDAGRLSLYGFDKQLQEARDLFNSFGYDKVMNSLDKKVQLL